jgi:hypothetical protein
VSRQRELHVDMTFISNTQPIAKLFVGLSPDECRERRQEKLT